MPKNYYDIAHDMLTAWRGIMSHVGSESDLHFEVKADYCTYHAPKTVVQHSGQFVGTLITVEGECDPNVLVCVAIYETIKDVCEWGTGVLAYPEQWDRDQVECAKYAANARARYDIDIACIRMDHSDNYVIR